MQMMNGSPVRDVNGSQTLPGDLIGIESLCEQRYHFRAVAFTDCPLEVVAPSALTSHELRETVMRQALPQQQDRLQDMARLRTGSVMQRTAKLLPPRSRKSGPSRRRLPLIAAVGHA